MLVAFHLMMVDSPDSADIQDLSSFSKEVVCRQSWWQRWSFWQFECSRTIMLKKWPGCYDDLFRVWNVSYSGHLLDMRAGFGLGSMLVLAALPHLQKVVNLGHCVQFPFLSLCLHFWVVFCVHGIQFWVSACQNDIIGSSKLPDNEFFAEGLAWGLGLPPANDFSAKGKTGLHSDTIWSDGKWVVRHIGEIGVFWVRFFLLVPPIGYVRYPKCTTHLHWVGVVIIEIWINLSPVPWCFRRRIRIEPGGGQSASCGIASSGCRLSHIVSRQVFLIITGRIIWITGSLIGPWCHCTEEEVVGWYSFECIGSHTSMFGTVFILHILHKGILVMCSVGCLVLKIDIDSLVPLSTRSQLAERIEVLCRNTKHARRWGHFCIVCWKLLSS